MTPVTYINLNNLLLIRDIQEIAKTYINDDRSYRWIWKNKIADVYHIGYVIPTVTKVLLFKDGYLILKLKTMKCLGRDSSN